MSLARTFSSLVRGTARTSSLRSSLLAVAAACTLATQPAPAAASGPLERLVQYVRHPSDPNVVVLRFGVASEGLLLSRDKGRSFDALCMRAIDPQIERSSPGAANHAAPIVMDADGRLVLAPLNGLWSDDGTGCSWTKQEAFAGMWVTGLALDPADPHQVLAIAHLTVGEGDALEVRAQLMRRDAKGTWTVQSLLRPSAPGMRAYGGNLVGAQTPEGPVLFTTVSSAASAGATVEAGSILVSRDGGASWTVRGALPARQSELELVASDPTDASRLLARVRERDQDRLLVSDDGGASFRAYLQPYLLSGVAFAPDGRVFIGDAGDSASVERTGGVYTAAKLGDMPVPVPQPPNANPATDCIGYDASENALRICRFHRYGTLDQTSGQFTQRMQMEGVKGLLSCPGRDIAAACEEPFNDGYGWCCTGHYPFTSFCAEYDVVSAKGRPVACGLAGRDADIQAGRGPQIRPR